MVGDAWHWLLTHCKDLLICHLGRTYMFQGHPLLSFVWGPRDVFFTLKSVKQFGVIAVAGRKSLVFFFFLLQSHHHQWLHRQWGFKRKLPEVCSQSQTPKYYPQTTFSPYLQHTLAIFASRHWHHRCSLNRVSQRSVVSSCGIWVVWPVYTKVLCAMCIVTMKSSLQP